MPITQSLELPIIPAADELHPSVIACRAVLRRHEAAMLEACDLLAERKYGNAARSPGHNARLVLEGALHVQQSPPGETK